MAAATAPVTKKSLMLPPSFLAAPWASLSGTARTSAVRCRDRFRQSGAPLSAAPSSEFLPSPSSCRPGLEILAHQGVQVDGLGRGRVRGALHPVFGQPPGADPVRDGMVELPQQGAAASLDAVDQIEGPQRPGAVIGVLIEVADQIQQ